MDDKLIPTLVLPGDEEEAQQAAAEAEAPVQEAAQPVQAAAAAVQTAPVEEAQQAPAQEEKKDEPLTPVDAQDDSLNFDNLSPEEQAAVLAFVERIDIHNSETVLKYGRADEDFPVLRQDSGGREDQGHRRDFRYADQAGRRAERL